MGFKPRTHCSVLLSLISGLCWLLPDPFLIPPFNNARNNTRHYPSWRLRFHLESYTRVIANPLTTTAIEAFLSGHAALLSNQID